MGGMEFEPRRGPLAQCLRNRLSDAHAAFVLGSELVFGPRDPPGRDAPRLLERLFERTRQRRLAARAGVTLFLSLAALVARHIRVPQQYRTLGVVPRAAAGISVTGARVKVVVMGATGTGQLAPPARARPPRSRRMLRTGAQISHARRCARSTGQSLRLPSLQAGSQLGGQPALPSEFGLNNRTGERRHCSGGLPARFCLLPAVMKEAAARADATCDARCLPCVLAP